MNLQNGKMFASKFVGTRPSSYEKRIYRAAVSQRLRNTVLNGTDGQTDRYGGTDSCFSQFHESTQTWKQYFGRKGCPSRSTN